LRFLYGTGESLAHVERAFEVDRQDLPPNVGIGIQNVADSPDAGAVDQPIEFSEPSNRSGHERGYLVPVRNVNADAIDPFAVPEFGHDLVFDPARDITAITVNRWPHGYAYEYNPLFDPDWQQGKAPHEIGRARFGPIAIANSDAAAAAYTDAAIDQARRAVEELLAG